MSRNGDTPYQAARVPADEAARLAALRRYHILDTAGEQVFDDLALLASTICATPIGVISLVDEERQWFKARVGLNASETTRDVAFCAHTILHSDVFIVPDATHDPRFAGNPLVTGDPRVRFYAGAPLETSDGFRLGALCAIDHAPRQLRPEQVEALRALARQVVLALELRRAGLEARRTEHTRREEEARYRELVENASDAIYTFDLEGRITAFNAAAERLTGHSRAAALTMTVDELLGPGSLAQARARLATADTPGRALARSTLHERDFVTKTGSRVRLEVRSQLVMRDGAAAAVLEIARDMTARNEAEALRAHLAAIVESSNDAIIGETIDGVINSWNDGAERLFGYRADEIVGQPISILIPAGHTTPVLEKLKRGEEVVQYETVRRHRTGTLVDVSVTASPMRDAAGRLSGASVIARDIRERLALERQRRDFLAMLTHDIKNPVGNMSGYLEVLSWRQDLDPKTRDVVTRMESSVETIRALVTNYLDLSKIEAGFLTLTKHPLDLNAVLARVTEQYEVEAGRRQITLEARLNTNLPTIEGDPVALERVFANLVSNAVKFTPAAGRVTLASHCDTNTVAVMVSDTGPGITRDEQPSLFQPYRQTATGRAQVGTGMGLFIAKSVVEAHGGTVGVSSEIGSGTTFTVTLPVVTHPGAAD
jgi:PAS domain S-box-containing protein